MQQKWKGFSLLVKFIYVVKFGLKLSFVVSNNQVAWVVQLVKNLPAIQETSVRALGQDDPLTHSRFLGLPW